MFPRHPHARRFIARPLMHSQVSGTHVDNGGMDLSRFDAAPITHLSYLSFEGQGAFPAEG
jgi:hypothetical protein